MFVWMSRFRLVSVICNVRIEGALNVGFVWDRRGSLREHAGVWEMNLGNEAEDIKGPHLSPQPVFSDHF